MRPVRGASHQTFKMALKYATQRLRAKAAMEKMQA
jgi:hypothetical protein